MEGRAQTDAYLEDYANVAAGLVALYRATFTSQWLFQARHLLQRIHDHFWDDAKGAAFQVGTLHPQLIVRRKAFYDNAEPSGNSAYAMTALQLAQLLDEPKLAQRAASIFPFVRHLLVTQPMRFGHLLCALDFYLHPSREIALVGAEDDAALP
jgi:uncharacterized protein YyaL (SSP411 family)